MKYITSRTLSMQWGVSQRRIVRMASEGRIKGAKLYGRSWVFPENTIKPPDGRTKEGMGKKIEKQAVPFRYPIFEYKDTSSFNPPLSHEERKIKALTEAFYACRYQEADALLGDLPTRTKNLYIRIVALYCGCMTSIFLGNVGQFLSYYGQLKEAMQDDFPHKPEMSEYLHELESTLGSDDYYASEFRTKSAFDYHTSFLPRLCNLSSVWIAFGFQTVTPADLTGYEINCSLLAKTDNYFDLQAMHIYLACAYSMKGSDKECQYHFVHALKLAEKYDMFYTIACMQFFYMPRSLEEALVDFPEAFRDRVLECNRVFRERYLQFTDALQFNSIYKLLKGSDYIYLALVVQGLTIKEVAKRMHKSVKTVAKHYSEIYGMLGVKRKKQAVSRYHDIITNPDSL